MPPKFHYQHWIFKLPLLRRYRGICLGRSIFFKHSASEVSDELIRHELVHQEQITRDGLARFYFKYLWHYVGLLARHRDHGRAYREIPYEKEAYARQSEDEKAR